MAVAQHLWQLALFFVIVLGPLPISLFLVATAEDGKRAPRLTRCLLVAGAAWCIVQLCIGLTLGILQRLSLVPVLLAEAAVLIFGLYLLSRVKCQMSLSVRGLLAMSPPLSSPELLILGTLCATALSLLLTVATRPLTDYDALAFHLPIMVNWYQSQSLAIVDYGTLKSGYPLNWEILGALMLMPFGEDFLVALPNLVAWIILGLSVYSIAVELGAARLHGLASAALMLMIPMARWHVNTWHVDLALAAFCLAAAYFGLAYHRTHSLPYLPLYLATVGLMMGIKTHGPAYGVVLLAGLAVLEIQPAVRRGVPHPHALAVRRVLPLAIFGVGGFLLMGGFWYLRNLIAVGNPLGDYAELSIGSVKLFPGKVSSSDLHSVSLLGGFDPASRVQWRLLFEGAQYYLSAPFFSMLLPAGLLPVFLVHRRTFTRRLLLGLLVFALGMLALYLITPYSWDWSFATSAVAPEHLVTWLGAQARFGFPFLAALAVVAAIGLSAMRARDEIILAVVLISAAVGIRESSLLWVGIILLPAWGLVRIGALTRVALSRLQRGWPMRLAALVLCLALIAGVSLQARQVRAAARVAAYGPILDQIAANLQDQEAVGIPLTHRAYLFFATDLDRKVVHLPAASNRRADWVTSLRGRGVALVAMGPLPPDWKSSREGQWLQDPNGPFTRVYDGEPTGAPSLFRLRAR